jgi:hypothetical protein|tara:strand:- start:2519 stop:2773 length:255 start_codon:yes stop_codon:yes gene_type:complete
MGISIKGTATALATGTTKFKTATAVYLCGHTSATEVTVMNEADNANVGTIKIPANGTVVVNLVIGQGLRGPTTVTGTHVASGSN